MKIRYYVISQYGHRREFVAHENAAEAGAMLRLTGKKTVTPETREAITALSGGAVEWELVDAPKAGAENGGVK
jgi:hypothetical protein